jgi:hypothetical protein
MKSFSIFGGRRFALAVGVLMLAFVPSIIHAQHAHAVPGVGTAEDRAAVTAAVEDYIEGFYQGDSTRHVRSVAPDVYKYGYGKRPDGYTGMQMTYAGFMSFDRGVKAGRNVPPANAPKEILLFEVQDQTAAAKVTAWWGIDYLLLGKRDGKWMITHVTWQSPPPQK